MFPCTANCIVGVASNGGQGKGYQNLDQTFHADFNELPFTSTALELIKMQLNSHNMETDSSEFALIIIQKIQMKRDFTMSHARNTALILAPRFLERHAGQSYISAFQELCNIHMSMELFRGNKYSASPETVLSQWE